MFFFLFALLISLFIIKYTKKVLYWRLKGIPSPIPLPILGIGIEHFTQDVTKIHTYRQEKYGKIHGLWLGDYPLLVVSDPEFAKIVTQKKAENFTNINLLKIRTKFFKDSFTLKKGNEWRAGRALVSPIFTTRRIKDIFPQIKKATRPFFENIENLIKEGKQDEIDVKDLLRSYSLDVIAKFVFALELNSAKDKNHEFVECVKKLFEQQGSYKFFLLTILPGKIIELLEKYDIVRFFNTEAFDYLENLCKCLVKQRRENKDLKYNDFLDLLIHTIDEKDLKVSESEIISYCLLFIFAGLETISMTISNILYCLILHPEYQEKLYDELIDLFADKEIDYEHVNDSKLLDAIVKESQRLYPGLNMITRVADNPIEIKGIKLDAGQAVSINVFNLHFNKEFWGDNVNDFYPERFYDEKKMESEDALNYAPFGSGIRSCLAKRYALVQVKYTLAKIILNYEVFQTAKTSVPPKYLKNPTALIYKDMTLGFKRREN